MGRTNVGTWRATSESYVDVLFTMRPQTWHATKSRTCASIEMLNLSFI
ncbi:MAG: hypothetical protein HDS16_03905 [Bacteroides sp.]|nr:hypothetical protein [Bacteroides sp.]